MCVTWMRRRVKRCVRYALTQPWTSSETLVFCRCSRECHVLLVERLPPFREFEEALGDQSDGNGKGRQRKEHENQNEDALGQVHWRHFCWHSSHDTKCPVKAENICLWNASMERWSQVKHKWEDNFAFKCKKRKANETKLCILPIRQKKWYRSPEDTKSI